MRLLTALVLSTLASCAATNRPAAVAVNGPEITLALGTSDQGSVLNLSIRNRSDAPMCISAEAVRNPDTTEMDLRIRDAQGRRIAGFTGHPHLSEPLRETVRVEPGAGIEARYYLDSRFPHAEAGRPFPAGSMGRARFRYGDCRAIEAYCDGRVGTCPDAWSLRADSGWQVL